ncbi:glycoside hydrolase family 9 protein [Planctomycetota bacterium]
MQLVTRILLVLSLLFSVRATWCRAGSRPDMPMPVPTENTIGHRWLQKPVQAERLLDDMEDLGTWSHQGFGKMTLTQERSQDGTQSLRLTSPTKGDKPGGAKGRPFGAAIMIRRVPDQDWSDYNRISFWVYPSLPGFRVISLSLTLHNDGQEKVPGSYGRNGRNFVLLQPDQWNHVVWEIAHLGRDKVTGVEFAYRLQGNEPGATTTVCYDFDHLTLQKVDADHYEGWDVAPGHIAFCHTGYTPDSSKIALASYLNASHFSIIDAKTGDHILTKSIRTQDYHLGRYQVLDFTEIDRPGTYLIQAGNIKTRPFEIHPDIWAQTIWKTVNFFYCERCGFAVPGFHDVCHRDWLCQHGDKRILINGGWHDAGDLSQGLTNTAEGVYAMLALSERLRPTDTILSQSLREEAQWGLDWMLKTRFGDGFRCTWATMDFWTDGILGNVDDVSFDASDNPQDQLRAVSAQALASQLLKDIDAMRSAYCLQVAQDDWQAATQELKNPRLELAAAGLCAATDLFRATKEQTYADEAFCLAEIVLSCQQQTLPDWDLPLNGFFYTSPKKDRILHYAHRSHEQAPIVGLSALCDLFPDHPDWMKWYASVVLYSEYMLRISQYTAPYSMLPASVYCIHESDNPTFQEQIKNGIRLSRDYYLRLFPIWEAFRGNHGTVLSQTKGLSTAAYLRSKTELIELCRKQLQWALGRNPFCQSTMYGEGYDFAPQYTAMSGDMVGSLPVGIQTHFNRDIPYWPAENCYNWKEVWVHPSSRWLWLMCDLYQAELQKRGDFTLSSQTSPDGTIAIQLTTKTQTDTPFSIQTWNIDAPKDKTQTEQTDHLGKDTIVHTWHTKKQAADKPWVAVVFPKKNRSQRREILGGFPTR